MFRVDVAERNKIIKKAQDEERKRRDYEIRMFAKRKW
jgi:hypothetical protein